MSRRQHKAAASYIDRLTDIMIKMSGVVLIGMMAATIVDIGGRWLFNRALPGSTDLLSMGLALSLALALPAVTWRGNHIAIELLNLDPQSRIEQFRIALVGLASGAVFAALAWIFFDYAMQAVLYNDVIGYLEIPIAPVVFVLSATALAAAICFVSRALGLRPGSQSISAGGEEHI